MKKTTKTSLTAFVMIAILVSMNVIFGRIIAINLPLFKVTFSFLPTVVAAYYYGIAGGVTVGALGDFLGAVLFPTGAYFFPFTLSAALSGGWYGVALKGKFSFVKTLFAVIPEQIICSLLLNSWFISMISTKGFFDVFTALRLPQIAINLPVQILLTYFILKKAVPMMKLERI